MTTFMVFLNWLTEYQNTKYIVAFMTLSVIIKIIKDFVTPKGVLNE